MPGRVHSLYSFTAIAVISPILIGESNERNPLGYGAAFYKSCNASLSFSLTFGVPIEKCVFDCKHRSDCRVIMFHHRMKQCALISSFIGDITFQDVEPTCLYAEISTQNSATAEDSIVCNSTEKFDALSGHCVISDCVQPPAIANATLLSTISKVGSTSRYRCEAGYFGVGNPKIVCRTNGTWTPTNFSCYISDCQVPDTVKNAQLMSLSTKIGSTVRYKCEIDFLLIGDSEILCQLNATWTSVNFMCLYGYCSNPVNISNSNLQSTKTLLGTTNRYVCSEGYYGIGDPYIYCNMNVTWTSTNFRCEKLCSEPMSVPNGKLVSVDNSDAGIAFRVGTKLTYECNATFQGEGNTTTNVCVRGGRWEPRKVMCCWNDTVYLYSNCFKVYSMEKVNNYEEAYTTCSTQGMYLYGPSARTHSELLENGKVPNSWMLYYPRKSVLQRYLFEFCISGKENMTAAELNRFKSLSYDETRTEILNNGWDKPRSNLNRCSSFEVNRWSQNQPDGKDKDCIISGPSSNFLLRDIDCNFLNIQPLLKEDISFLCLYSPPYV